MEHCLTLSAPQHSDSNLQEINPPVFDLFCRTNMKQVIYLCFIYSAGVHQNKIANLIIKLHQIILC
jgi:hypothetical protein